MAETRFVLNDPELFSFCVNHIATLGFLSSETQQTLEALATKVKKSPLSPSDGKDLVDLWQNLVTDSIHALKARDRREKAWAQRETQSEDVRTTARCQNVYGAESLFEFFTEFTKFEQLLYGTEQHYRDHVAHPIRVWMTGVRIIEEWGGIQCLDFSEDREAGEIGDVEKWAAWTMIALCHDLGYPLEKAHKVTDQVDKMMEFFGNISTGRYRYSFQVHHQSLIEIMLRAVASKLKRIDTDRSESVGVSSNTSNGEKRGRLKPIFTTVVQPKYWAKFSHSFEQFQHGIISVLVLLKSLVYFMEMDFDFLGQGSLYREDARQFHIRREILRSIAAHTCPEVYHLKLNTPSFLLIVCDDLQEWGRPTLASMSLDGFDVTSGTAGKDTEVYVEACGPKGCELSCHVSYPSHGKREGKIMKEFRRYHKLLRAALDDAQREFVFQWRVKCKDNGGEKDVDLLFRYDSSKPPFEELDVWKNNEKCTGSFFSIS